MKNFKNANSIAGQSNAKVQKTQKHDVNLQKNSALYFQVGLILCLLGTYSLFEMNFKTHLNPYIDVAILDDEPTEFDVKTYVAEEAIVKQKQEKKAVKLTDQEPTIVDNKYDEGLIPDLVDPDVVYTDAPVEVGDVEDPIKIEEPIEKPFSIIGVEKVPIYPGCESKKNNADLIKCMNEKLGKLVQKRFNTALASDYGMSGLMKIDVQFKIDKQGNITDIKTRAPHLALEKEAERLAKRIPTMTPGKQREQPVSVLYNLPIVFKVQ